MTYDDIARLSDRAERETAQIAAPITRASVFFLVVWLILAAVKVTIIGPVVAFPAVVVAALLVDRDRLFTAVLCLLPFGTMFIPGLPLNIFVSTVPVLIGILLLKTQYPLPNIVRMTIVFCAAVMVASIVQTYCVPALNPTVDLDASFGVFRASRHRGWYQLAGFGVSICTLSYLYRLTRSPKGLGSAVRWLVAISFPVAAYGIYELAAKALGLPLVYFSFDSADYVSQSVISTPVGNLLRVYGTNQEPGYFGNYLLIPLSICLALLLTDNRHTRLKRHAKLLLPMVAVAMLLTFSTSAWAASVVTLMVILFGAGARRLALLLMFVVAVGLVWLSGIKSIEVGSAIWAAQTEKVAATVEGGDARATGRSRALEIFSEYPILGIGLGNEPFWMGDPNMVIGSYNIVLAQMTEMGFLGLISFLGLVGSIGSILLRGWRRGRRGLAASMSLAALAALAGMLMSHMAWGSRFAPWEWATLGIGIGAARIALAPSAFLPRGVARGRFRRSMARWRPALHTGFQG